MHTMTSPGTSRTAIIATCRLSTEAIQRDFAGLPEFEVVYAGSDIDEARQTFEDSPPHLLVLDADHPSGQIFEVASETRRLYRQIKLVFVTSAVRGVQISQALQLKARGILTKDESGEFLYEALLKILAGHRVFSRDVERHLDYRPLEDRYVLRHQSPLNSLTVRQLEVLRHLCEGDSVKMVARKLHLSPKSVDCHKYRIMRKVGVNNSVSLVRCAIREGLIEP